MRTSRRLAQVAATAALALTAAACGGGSGGTTAGGGATGGATGGSGGAQFDAATKGIVNPSDKQGGTLKLVLSDAPDSMDPGNTYYAYNWNFTRQYARALTTFPAKPGTESLQVTPDLAESLGVASDGGRTWTYKLRPGVKYEDGTPVTAKDVKYAIARSNYSDELALGPKYFQQYLAADGYKGPYKDKNLDNFKGIETPDDRTLVFRLNAPFAEFDYLVTSPQAAPVPQSKDTGVKYQEKPLSTGPYKFESHSIGKSLALVRNPNWDKATDPMRKPTVDRIELQMKVDAADIDQRLLAGTADIDLGGTGVQSQTIAQILPDPERRKNADNPLAGFLRYANIATTVPPFNNVECRKAVLYAADHEALQGANGGQVGGDIATTVLPPTVAGYKQADTYGFLTDRKGNVDKAKQALAACGQPNGFSTKIAARADRPREVAAAEALQQSLQRVGIKTDIAKYPSGDYSSQYAGNPKFVKANNIGIMMLGWAPDWPSGFGFLSQIADGRAIKPNGGNYNNAELNDPAINALFDRGIQNNDLAQRNEVWGQIDQKIMESATFLPIVYAKVLLYRNPSLTNVFVSAAYGGEYDYTAVGKQ